MATGPGKMIGGGLEGGPSQPAGPMPTPFHGFGQQWQPALATMIGGGLEGGPSQPAGSMPTPFHGYDGA